MMMKPTLILGVAILVTFAAQGDTLAIDDQSDNSTCPPHCDFCTGEDYLCRYHPRQDYNCPSRCEYCLGGECYRNFVQIPGWLIASIVVAALVIFVLFPCAICHCRRQDCYHHCGYNHPEVMHVKEPPLPFEEEETPSRFQKVIWTCFCCRPVAKPRVQIIYVHGPPPPFPVTSA